MHSQIQTMTVFAGRDEFVFQFSIRKAESPSEQQIEPEFYIQNEGHVHHGTHYEMEILRSPVWGRISPDIPVHIHVNPTTNKPYVCFTGQVKTPESVTSVLRVWCVGTIFSLLHKQDFQPLVGEHGSNFLKKMKEDYDISIKT